MKENNLLKLFFLSVYCLIVISCSPSKQQTTFQTVHIDSIYANIDNNDEIKIKLYLAEKYHPGNCFGMPSIQNPRYLTKINPELLLKVKELRPNKTDKEYDVLIRQMMRIVLEKVESNEFNFYFNDGRCCNIFHYKGKILLMGDTIYEKDTETTVENVPC